MQRLWAGTSDSRALTWAGLALTAACVAFVIAVVGSTYPTALEPLVLGTVLVAISLPVLMRQARREQSDRLFWFLVAALIVKLIASVVRYQVAFGLYGGIADAGAYHQAGVRISEAFRQGNFDTGMESLTSTNFIRLVTGIVYTVIGPNMIGGFLIFSWLGYWGIFLFYRAFTIAVPEGRSQSYARLVFFLPSMLFWPSSIGKEAWMIFALGIAAFGIARILSNSTLRGLAIAALGLWLSAIVRPHIAGIAALALAGAYLLRKTRPELRQLGPIVKGFSLAVLVVLAAILVVRTDRFLQQQGISTTGGASAVSSAVQERTGEGGSAFAPKSIIQSPAHAPISIVSVLFRPLPFDAQNAQSMATALEGTFLLLFSLVRIRWLIAAVKSSRRQPYVAFALLYTLLFVVGFSSVANFGLLARERVQLLPMYLVLFTIPRPDRSRKEEDTMDEPRGNWLNDPPDTPRPRRPWRSSDPAQPDIANLIEHLQALEARTQELEAELRRERTAPAPPSPATEEPAGPSGSGDDMTARFTELARRTFGEEFEHLRQEAQRQADEIVAQARTDADRRAQEILGRARDEANRISSAARKQAEAAKAAKAESASRAKQLADDLRGVLSWIDRTLEELDQSEEVQPGETGPGETEAPGRAGDLVVITTKDERSPDEAARTSSAGPEEPAG